MDENRLIVDENIQLGRAGRFMPLLLGLICGIGLGLYMGWVLWPTEIIDATPSFMQEQYRIDYTLMIAAAYAADGDLGLAQRRLATLEEVDVNAWLLALTNNSILDSAPDEDIRHLIGLAEALGLGSPLIDAYLADEVELGLPGGDGEG
ncbi:MAG TPA: hypothetical protein VLL52_12310 [Anaerolineae bacterium]|nr:hypothetical protein [Anaerolineae bacterium]